MTNLVPVPVVGWGGNIVCPPGGKCQICNCMRHRIFDPCNPPQGESAADFVGQKWGGCSAECQGQLCVDSEISLTLGLGLVPEQGSTLSGRGPLRQGLRGCSVSESVYDYPRELESDVAGAARPKCELEGTVPGDESLALPGGGEARIVRVSDACCHCGGGEYTVGGAENGGQGIDVKTTILAVPEGGCQNGNNPVEVGEFLVGFVAE